MKNIKLILMIAFCSMALTCTKSKIAPCESPLSIFEISVSFFLQDDNGVPLIGDFGRKYDSNQTKVKDSNNAESSNWKIRGDGLILINPSNASDNVGQEILKSFFIVLPATPDDPMEDRDTLDFKYSLLRSECSMLWYDSVSIFFNQELLFTGNFPFDYIKITKK